MMARTTQRAFHNKSKTGCRTCRSRRVKCDETKPTCTRCKSARRSCGGYEPFKVWLFEPTSTTILATDCHERRALQFFQYQTSPILAAFSKFTQRFWEDFIARMALAEPAVRHMTIALATRQEGASCSPDDLYSLSRLRSHAFSSALQLLVRPEPQTSTLAILMSCLLFVGYEAFEDPTEMTSASVKHLGAGLRILEDQSTMATLPSTSSYTEAVHVYLQPMYLQLEMMLSMLTTPIVTRRRQYLNEVLEKPKLPSRFPHLAAARISFYKIFRWHFAFRVQEANEWTPQAASFLTIRYLFLEWHRLVMLYNDALPLTDLVQKRGLLSMVSHWRLYMVALVHSAATIPGSSAGTGSPYLPRGGRLKTSLVDLMEPDHVKISFVVDKQTLPMLEVCDWSDSGLLCDPSLRIWPTTEVRKLADGRGFVQLVVSA